MNSVIPTSIEFASMIPAVIAVYYTGTNMKVVGAARNLIIGALVGALTQKLTKEIVRSFVPISPGVIPGGIVGVIAAGLVDPTVQFYFCMIFLGKESCPTQVSESKREEASSKDARPSRKTPPS